MNNPSGRPATEAIMLARLNGDKTYLGKQCKKCGGCERYTRGGGSCVACQRAHSIESRAALKRLDSEHGRYGGEGTMGVTRADIDNGFAALTDEETFTLPAYTDLGDEALTPRYFWHPESGALFETDGEVPESEGTIEEVDVEKYRTLMQEACFLGAGQCPTPGVCETLGCAGAPSPVNDTFESAVDKEPEPWD